MSNEQEKTKLSIGTLNHFCKQFGDDVYSEILIDVLLEGVINAETLFIFGEQEQERDQVDNNSTERNSGELKNNRLEQIEPTKSLGESDYPDYP